ncbi:MAG: PhoX family phosphatase, partial [Mycobacteriales bacterium]
MTAVYDDDAALNPATEPHMSRVISMRMSRRTLLGGGMAAAAGFLSSGLLTSSSAAADPGANNGKRQAADLLGYDAIALGFTDEIAVPAGYSSAAFIPWGTPILGSFPAFVPAGNTAAEQAEQIGMNHDGMHYFPLAHGPKGSERGLLVLNHEYTDEGYLHTGTLTVPAKASWTLEMVRKSQNAHGVAVVEIERVDGEWTVIRSGRNRRVTANTPMAFAGPAAGHRLVRTAADPEGMTPLGTFNNCANGHTPWGTYLTCEENFNGYFRVDAGAYDAEHVALNARYGVGGDRNNWATNDPRFVVTAADPNEPNRHGWVVEIDPFNPTSTPIKRTALGRLKHEGAYAHVSKGGRVVVYMGDDQVNEYVYKFVSAGNWKSLNARGMSPLDEGTLYVGRFNDDGSGEWLALVHGEGPLSAANGFADQGDVLVKARLAATALGATPMDRSEWTTVDENTGMVYVTLTNNNSTAKVENAANPRKPNKWGHIIRWAEDGNDHAATTFQWDLFLLAGQGRSSGDGSTIEDQDAFGSPDGIWADPDGRVWIQTDGRQPAGANDQMLAANPYLTDAQGAPEIKRFLTGVINCEVTGVITTPDQRTMFVNIQHPGET